MGAILLFAFGTRLIRLNAPPERFFDEVYHAYTAEQWMRGNHDAWLWSTKAPDKGCAYEWTHPPLAKLAMTAGMKCFGTQPWAWRLPAAVLGTVSVLLVFLIGRRLFQDTRVGLLAAALASLDTLPLVMSRIGMNDIYCVTMVLAAVLAALHSRYVLSAVAIGIALACKWSALYALPLLALIHLLWVRPSDRWRIGRLCGLGCAYAVAVPVMYLGSYLPFFQTGHDWDQFVELQRQMWYYHTKLEATHPYSSKAWQWPLDNGAVWCHTAQSDDQPADDRTDPPTAGEDDSQPAPAPARVANIYAVGNPAIWLTGLGAMAFMFARILRRRDPRLVIVLAGYLVFWAPWLISPRIMFIYHYLPSLPFLYLGLAAAVIGTGVRRSGIAWLLGLAGLFLVLMYPYVTAVSLPEALSPNQLQSSLRDVVHNWSS